MIESLKFFTDRQDLAGPDGFQLGSRHKDRTVNVVRKWLSTNAALRQARSATMQTLTARPGKNGNVLFDIMDRLEFDRLQDEIAGHEEQIRALEAAIKELDTLAAGGELWYSDVEFSVGGLSGVEGNENRRLANCASAVLSRRMNTGLPADQILQGDDEYMRLSGIAKEQIDNANKQLAILRPKLESLKQLLESVGC